jgi:hypothetical protein
MTTTTKKAPVAVRRAEAYAERLRKAGWHAEVRVTHTPPEMYPHKPGEVMLDGYTSAWVSSRPHQGAYDGDLHFGWHTWDGAGGNRSTTSFYGGTYNPLSGKERKLRTYGDLATWLSIAAGVS